MEGGCETSKQRGWRVRALASLMHGNMELFCFLTASRDKAEIRPSHRLKSKTDPGRGGGL